MKYEVSVQDDDRFPGSYMVVIYRITQEGRRELVGIPERQTDRRTAELTAAPIMYAFDYGLVEMRRRIESATRLYSSVELEPK